MNIWKEIKDAFVKGFKNWITTLIGSSTFVGVLVNYVLALTDNDPSTVADLGVVIMAVGTLLVGLYSKDANVGSSPDSPQSNTVG